MSAQKQAGQKLETAKSSKAADLERIRQNLAKRSLDVRFDLQGSDYRPIENIGIGAYGVVCSAVHTKSGDRMAIKKITHVFEAITIAKRTYREIKILKHFKHDNIISIREILLPKENMKDFKDIYVVFDLMESDLHRIIYSKQELSDEHIRYFLYQILRGLKYIHSAHVIHRDLKPSNLLVNEDCHLRIGDFGMARGMFYTPDEPSYYMTQYVATRWYRAPEILLSMLEYGTAVDMWSVGCIFAEMMGRKHLFPGKDFLSQVKLILGVLGTPSETILRNCHNDILRRIIKSLGKKDPISWDKLFPKANKKSLDLLGQMLVLNPADRISVEQALSHKLLHNYHDPDDEPICVPTFHFDFEKQDMDKSCLRQVIMEEIMSFHQPKQPTLSFSAFLRPAPKSDEIVLKVDNLKISHLTGETGDKATGEHIGGESKPSTKVSPVSVDVSKLQVAQSADIEMLSAQSVDGRAMETQQTQEISVNKVKREEKEEKKAAGEKDVKVLVPSSTDKRGGNTISEDTKARVKQALMNANQRRQRAEPQGEEPKESKLPVTAAQRQKEREDKRRKKKERALEKVKKSKDKKGGQEQAIMLSTEDMELLRRWTVMQNPGQADSTSHSPPHPGPAVTPPQSTSTNGNPAPRKCTNNTTIQKIDSVVSAKPSACGNQGPSAVNKPRQILAKTSAGTTVAVGPAVNITSNQMTSGGTVFIPSTQLTLSQTNFIPVIAIPSAVNPGKIEIKRIFQPSDIIAQTLGTTAPSVTPPVESAKNLLHNAILMRSQGNSTNTVSQTLSVIPSNPCLTVLHNETNLAAVSFRGSSFADNKALVTQANVVTADPLTASIVGSSNIQKSEESRLSKEDILSPGSQDNDLLDFLNKHLEDSPKEKPLQPNTEISITQPVYSGPSFIQIQCMPEQASSFAIARPSPQNSPQHSVSTPPAYSNYSQTHSPEEQLASSSSTPTLHQQKSHSPNLASHSPEQPHRSSISLTVYETPSSPASFLDQSHFSSGFITQNADQPEHFSQQSSPANFQRNFINQENFQNFTQTTSAIFDSQIPHPDLLFQSPTDFSPHLQHQPQIQLSFENAEAYKFNNFTSSTMQFDQNFSNFSEDQQGHFNQYQTFSSNQYPELSSHSQSIANHLQGRNHGSTNLPSTADSRGFGSSILQPTTNMGEGPSTSGLSVPGQRLTVNCGNSSRPEVPQADLEHLSKLLSKSGVVDIFPPALALTPRGTGAGYGVGMDLDHMLTDAQDHASVRVDQSPLSSSLLQDWLDISGISQADLEALERELVLQSPMSISYNDNMLP